MQKRHNSWRPDNTKISTYYYVIKHCHTSSRGYTRHVQKVSSDRAYRPRRRRERGAPARWCLRSREGYIRHSFILILCLSFCLEMSMKIENPPVVKYGQRSNFWMPKMYARLKCIGKFVKFMEKMLWVMEWWEDGVGCSVKGGRMSTMTIEVAAHP
jgi:hypothetical protein